MKVIIESGIENLHFVSYSLRTGNSIGSSRRGGLRGLLEAGQEEGKDDRCE